MLKESTEINFKPTNLSNLQKHLLKQRFYNLPYPLVNKNILAKARNNCISELRLLECNHKIILVTHQNSISEKQDLITLYNFCLDNYPSNSIENIDLYKLLCAATNRGIGETDIDNWSNETSSKNTKLFNTVYIWLHCLNATLDNQSGIGLLPLFENYFDQPAKLMASIIWMMDQSTKPIDIINSGLLHRFINKYSDMTRDNTSVVKHFRFLLNLFSTEHKGVESLLQMARYTHCGDSQSKCISLSGYPAIFEEDEITDSIQIARSYKNVRLSIKPTNINRLHQLFSHIKIIRESTSIANNVDEFLITQHMSGNSMLHWMVDELDSFKLLLLSIPVDRRIYALLQTDSETFDTILHWAADKPEVIKFIFAAIPNTYHDILLFAKNHNNELPIHYATYNKNSILEMISHCPIKKRELMLLTENKQRISAIKLIGDLYKSIEWLKSDLLRDNVQENCIIKSKNIKKTNKLESPLTTYSIFYGPNSSIAPLGIKSITPQVRPAKKNKPRIENQ